MPKPTTLTQQATTVAIVDDHYMVREGFVRMVDSMPGYTVAFQAENGLDYIAKCKAHGAPALVLVDLSMPAMDGFQLVAWIREHQPATRALVLSLYTNDERVRRAVHAGACGYLAKDGNPTEVREALDHVRLAGFHNNALTHQRLIARPQAAAEPNPLDELSDRQKDVLREMMKPGKMTAARIAEVLDITPNTVRQRRKEIFQRLGVNSAHEAVTLARRWGFK